MITVKDLEWVLTSYGTPEAGSIIGIYRIVNAGNGGWAVSIRGENLRDTDGRTNFPTVESAKSASKAHYASRILSALKDDTQ